MVVYSDKQVMIFLSCPGAHVVEYEQTIVPRTEAQGEHLLGPVDLNQTLDARLYLIYIK